MELEKIKGVEQSGSIIRGYFKEFRYEELNKKRRYNGTKIIKEKR